jgi:GH15 family glucan-1,4-alpha-glucosidase
MSCSSTSETPTACKGDPNDQYRCIDSYGVIGNMRTSAHISKENASIDWYCYPHFSSPSLFARILDYNKGGFFEIQASNEHYAHVETKQGYWPDTNILCTIFTIPDAMGQVVDWMPVLITHASGKDPDHFSSVQQCMEKYSLELRDKIGSASLMNTSPHYVASSTKPETEKYKWIVRRVEVSQGSMNYTMKCAPAFNYARDDHQLYLTSDKKKAVFVTDDLVMTLESSEAKLVPFLSPDGKNLGVRSDFGLTEETCATFVFREASETEANEARTHIEKSGALKKEDIESEPKSQELGAEANHMQAKTDWLFVQTMDYWHSWIGRCKYQGRWREHIYRSALILKLCIFEPSGAIVAAPTTSLPEKIGGVRNWDYRFTWLRDAAYVVYSLIRVGFYSEAENFMSFLEARCKESIDESLINVDMLTLDETKIAKEQPLRPIYTIDGNDKDMEEIILDHLEGYKGSKPVRIGNAASNQLQLDVYGELMDSIYLYNKYSKPVSFDFWRYIVYIVNWVCVNAFNPDDGVWEVRGQKQHFLYSKVLCWVCIDRGLRLADKRSFPAPKVQWMQIRDKLMAEIMEKGFNTEIGAFTQAYGSKTLDASALILPLILFMSPTDPRMLSTIAAINRSPKKGGLVLNSLVYRYDPSQTDDGFAGEKEGSFNMCTFWLIECLCRTGQKQKVMEARLKLELFFAYANHVGLFSEEMSADKHHLGNYPQAFTHLSLISAAFNLNRVLDNSWRPMTTNQ